MKTSSAELDWHAERSDLSGIALLNRSPESEGIVLHAVCRYRLGRVRQMMVSRSQVHSRFDGTEGVKLEQQVLVTDSGIELLSEFPFEDSLIGLVSV